MAAPVTPVTPETPATPDGIVDLHSYANVDQFRTKHIDLNLDVDFPSRQLMGTAVLSLQRLDTAANRLVLDSKGLTVLGVATLTTDIVGATEKPKPIWVSRPFHFGKADAMLGRALIIDLPQEHQPTEVVKIEYETAAEAPGLQWRGPKLTESRPPRFLYTQSEPINARSWIPLQDTPRARFTYRAHIKTDRELLALMGGGIDTGAKRNGDYLFVMNEPVSPYAICLAVGDFSFKALSPRIGVFAEHHLLSAARAAFTAAPALLAAGEQLVGGPPTARVDLLVMPDAFPAPAWTQSHLVLISPTLVGAGRDAAAPLADAIAQTWSRQLLGAAEWRDRWIGEALAAYWSGRMLGAVFGERRAALEALEDSEALRARPPDEQVLSRDLVEPASLDVFDPVARQKGRLLFATLEQKFGRDELDASLREFVLRYTGKTATTQEFAQHLREGLIDRHPGRFSYEQLQAWIYDPGIPRDAALPDPGAWTAIDRALAAFTSGAVPAAKLGAEAWSAPERRHFVCALPVGLAVGQLMELDHALELTGGQDAVGETCWLRLAIVANYRPVLKRVDAVLAAGGRPELLAPLYRALQATPAGSELAKRLYLRVREGYHPAAVGTIDAIVTLEPESESP